MAKRAGAHVCCSGAAHNRCKASPETLAASSLRGLKQARGGRDTLESDFFRREKIEVAVQRGRTSRMKGWNTRIVWKQKRIIHYNVFNI